ncbi:hypothetical protein [Salinibacterium sp. TMP30]|uniref:hypothetical protein n=1 Tax=Salinibacterium sp. TMP30 TaxID=3138237 RepID=UPI003139BD49
MMANAFRAVQVESDPGMEQEPYLAVRLDGVPRSSLKVSRSEFLGGGLGLIRQLENRTSAVPRIIGEIEQEDVVLNAEILEADARLRAPFAHSDALASQQAAKESEKRAEPTAPVRRTGPGPEVPGNRPQPPSATSAHEVSW